MVKPKAWQYKVDDPVMSDLTILMSLEDLINNAMGPAEKNIVNYKLIQAVLHILARQLRILETKVELRISDGHTPKEKKKKSSSSGSPSSGSSPKRDMKDIKEEKGGKSKKLKDKADKSASKEKEKAERAEMKDKERAEKAAIKGKDKEEKVALKEKEKAEKYEAKEEERIKKMSPKQREKYLKEKEKEHEKLEKMTPEEKNKYLENKAKKLEEMSPEEREQKALEYLTAQETRELNKMSPKERDQFLKEKEKEFKKLDKMSPQERQQYVKEKESEEPEKVTPKERETFIKEKEKEILEKMTPKEKAQYLKEKEKESKVLEKMSPKEKEKYFKEKEKELKALEKMSPNEIEKYFKEKEKESKMLEKMSPQEKEKYLEEKEADEVAKISPKQREKQYKTNKEKEEELLKKMSPKEKEHYFKEKQKKEHDTGSGTSIAISEVERENEKVLIVKKGPSVRSTTGARGGSIEVVTQSQFELLKAAVERLKEVAGPLPMPALPDNKQLRSDLAKGTASLTDTMQAMQVSARIQAAEQGITRMAGLLTQLAASGALPAEIAAQIEDVKSEMEAITALAQEKSSVDPSRPSHVGTAGYRKSVAIDPMSTKPSRTEGTTGGAGGRPSSAVSGRASIGAQSRTSRTSSVVPNTAITRNEMDDAIQTLKDELMKSMHMMTNRATTSADAANGTAKAVSDKMDFALRLNARIAELYSLTADYAEQLSGFDAGVTTQMQSFQEQMGQMRLDLKAGLAQLETANNNAETAAVMELNERYEGLVLELDGTITAHQHLTSFQKQLGDELRSLLEAVETLREQKADRDEVLDGLRDKADNSKLAGLLTEQEFVQARDELELRLHLCYQKFVRQEAVWMQAVKDLDEIVESKAHMMQVLAMKEDAQDALRAIQEEMKILAVQLGEPTVAVLTRVISRDGHCASCLEPGLIGPTEQTFAIPRPLPALRPATEPEPCLQPQKKLFAAGDGDGEGVKSHICKRWVGGSHTLVTGAVTRGAAPPPPRAAPVRHYTDYGEDGKLYRLAEELQPCEECNVEVTEEIKSEEKPRNYGTVDAPICICWPPLPIP